MQPGAVLPELILLVGSTVCLVAGLFTPRRDQGRIRWLATVALVAAAAAAVPDLVHHPGEVFAGTYTVDAATGVGRLVASGAALIVVWLAADWARNHPRETEVYVLVLFATLGAVLLAGASDLLLLVVAYLLTSVPLYTLTAFAKDAHGTEAAMKYLLMGALAGVTMLYGLAWLYAAGGATAYRELAAGLEPGVGTALVVGTTAAIVGLLFKLGAVPVQFWVPDVADAAPAPVAAYVTTIPKVAALVATARLLVVIPEDLLAWPTVIAVVAAASMTLGNLAAFWQQSPRRLLAYSTISQVGYLLMAVTVAGRSELAMPALLLYATAYAAMNLGAFGVVAALPAAATLRDHSGLIRAQPALALSLAVCLLSLVGIPPLGGFFGKLTVFIAAWDGGFAWLVVIAAVNTVISVFYYLRWLVPALLRPPADGSGGILEPVGRCTRNTVVVAAGLTVGVGLAAQAILLAAG